MSFNDLGARGARKSLWLNNLRLGTLLDWLDQGPGMRPACAKKNKLKKYLDKIEGMNYIKTMKQEIVSRYEWAKVRFENGLISQDEWFKLCFEILGEIMEENKDVFIRLKNR